MYIKIQKLKLIYAYNYHGGYATMEADGGKGARILQLVNIFYFPFFWNEILFYGYPNQT